MHYKQLNYCKVLQVLPLNKLKSTYHKHTKKQSFKIGKKSLCFYILYTTLAIFLKTPIRSMSKKISLSFFGGSNIKPWRGNRKPNIK